MNLDEFLRVIGRILSSAFAPEPLVGGLGGGVLAAVINGTKRGLFSNEAGQGTAPNAAATATVSHPVQQGFIQSLGVFIDTIVVCTATAFVILIAGPQTWTAEGAGPATLTTLAISHELGGWTVLPMAVLIFVLAYSSIIAAYVYSDTNMSFVFGDARWATWTVRVVCVASATIGALLTLDVVWNAVDIAMASPSPSSWARRTRCCPATFPAACGSAPSRRRSNSCRPPRRVRRACLVPRVSGVVYVGAARRGARGAALGYRHENRTFFRWYEPGLRCP